MIRALSHSLDWLERIGRTATTAVARVGYGAMILLDALKWLVLGYAQRQPVRLGGVVLEVQDIGVRAIPIVMLLSATIGVILTIQGIHTLSVFGAEHQVVVGIGIAVLREFGPLITGIVVTARSGAAIAARLGTMRINQELDALTVMGIEPVRYLVAPILLAMLIMVPALTLLANAVAVLAAAQLGLIQLGMPVTRFALETLAYTGLPDLALGMGKAVVFATLIALIGVVNGASVTGGAQGVGHATTRSVVQGITAVIVVDMVFGFLMMV